MPLLARPVKESMAGCDPDRHIAIKPLPFKAVPECPTTLNPGP